MPDSFDFFRLFIHPWNHQETVINEMVELAVDLQAEYLKELGQQRPNDAQLHEDLEHIMKTVPGNETSEAKADRVAAEQRVMCAALAHGERIGHGDLLTFQKVRQARLLRVSSVSAIGRLDYLGLFRLGLFHLVADD